MSWIWVARAAEVLLQHAFSLLPADGTSRHDNQVGEAEPTCLTESLASQARLLEHRQLPRHFFTVHVLKKTYSDADAFHLCSCCMQVLPTCEVRAPRFSEKNVSIGQANQVAQAPPSLP